MQASLNSIHVLLLHFESRGVDRFKVWAADRDNAANWDDYLREAKLSRSEIATECGFGRAALQQNPSDPRRVLAATEAVLYLAHTLVESRTTPQAHTS